MIPSISRMLFFLRSKEMTGKGSRSAGRDYVVQNHSWQAVLAGLDKELEGLRHAQNRLISHEQNSLRPAI